MKDSYGGLNRNVHRFKRFVTMEWRHLKGLEGLGNMALMEGVCYLGLAVSFQKPMPSPVSLSRPADQDTTLSYCYSALHASKPSL